MKDGRFKPSSSLFVNLTKLLSYKVLDNAHYLSVQRANLNICVQRAKLNIGTFVYKSLSLVIVY